MKATTLIIPLLVLVMGCQTSPTADPGPDKTSIHCTTDDAKSMLIADFLDGYTRQDLSLADTVFAENVKFYWADRAQPFDRETWTENIALQQKAFRDFELVDRSISSGRYGDGNIWTNVWCEWTAVNRGTGKPLSLLLHLSYKWDGDKVVEEYGFFDGGRFKDELALSLSLQDSADAPCPWDWLLGEWRVSGGPMPDAVVRWTRSHPEVDSVMGEWITADGVRVTQLVGWHPDSGRLVSNEYGSDGSSMRIVMDSFPHGRHMSGTFKAIAADGSMSVGEIDANQTSDDVFVVTLTDPSGEDVVRTFRPVVEGDALAAQLPIAADQAIVTTMDDERSRRIAAALVGYAGGDLSFADDLFAPGVEFYRSDSTTPVDIEAWRTGAAVQQAAFEDVAFSMPAIVTTTYPDFGSWTYAWCVWRGTSRATGETLTFPVHVMWQWDGDRVIREFGYFDAGRFADDVATTMARLNPSDEASRWDWLTGVWKMTGGGQPDAIVSWSKLDPDAEAAVGQWVDSNGVRSLELLGWEPEFGRLSVKILGSDGGNFHVTLDDFSDDRLSRGDFHARSGEGAISEGRFEVDRVAEDRIIIRMIDAAGTTIERVLTPAAEDDPMRWTLPPTVAADDWRTKAINEMHANYEAQRFDEMAKLFADDCRREWGDPNVTFDRAAWLEGLKTHHAVFKDIRLDDIYTMTGQYPDGNVWSATWFEWNGVVRKTGEEVAFLVHGIHRWDGDQIVEEKVFMDGGRFGDYIEDAMAE